MRGGVLEPADAREAAALLADASAARTSIVIRGAGTKLDWGARGAPDCALSTLRLDRPIDHQSGDLIATVPAGARLADVNAQLGLARQWLPLDPPRGDRATIGGIVATNDSGPRRHRYGAPRDLVVGIEIALPDGRVAKAGGRVVKNVSGYDLGRLLCGSFGTLACITSVTFKLAPVEPSSITLVAGTRGVRQALEIARTIHAAPLAPSAIEFATSGGPSSNAAPARAGARLLVRFETAAAAMESQAAAAERILIDGGAAVERVSGAAESSAWSEHEAHAWSGGETVVKVSVLPSEVAGVLAAIEQFAETRRMSWAAAGRAALGVFYVALHGGNALTQGETAGAIRRAALTHRGTAVILDAPAALRSAADHWGDLGPVAVMAAVKAQFDPQGVLRDVFRLCD